MEEAAEEENITKVAPKKEMSWKKPPEKKQSKRSNAEEAGKEHQSNRQRQTIASMKH